MVRSENRGDLMESTRVRGHKSLNWKVITSIITSGTLTECLFYTKHFICTTYLFYIDTLTQTHKHTCSLTYSVN